MRELKFRSWDGESMWNNVELNSNLWNENVMQYTGLKDKNGVEIYEGDIVRPKMYSGITKFNFPVDYRKGSFYLKGRLSGFNILRESLSNAKKAGNDYEVVGNIYENPELLEDINNAI